MSLLSHRPTLRWKEWIPLVTQQQRLRSLIQVIAYNIRRGEKSSNDKKPTKCSYYYTLHLTTMSAPFYTSEKLESDNPKWGEIEINEVNGAANGVVIRLWCHSSQDVDQIITVWGIYFSGLVYLGPRLVSADPSTFLPNTIVLHMQGGYFTAPHCFKQPTTPTQRLVCVTLNTSDVRLSYSVNLLSRLHTIQKAIKKQMVAAASLRERISAGGVSTMPEPRESAMLRRLLNRSRPKPQREEVLRIRKEIEFVKFKVQMLTEEKKRKSTELRKLGMTRDANAEAIQDNGIELMERYRSLQKDVEHLKETKRSMVEARENLNTLSEQLQFRRRQLISELNYIYPIEQVAKDKYTVCGVHLPNSEDFAGHDETTISVALGYVAHLVQMISNFLHVPLRYPICHLGSRSKVIDHIIDKIPDKDREFPLFSRGKDKLQFHYGVYLLNKNIAQLRWYCGIATTDLRATLPNLMALLNLKPSHNPTGLEVNKRTMSGSSLEMQGSTSPVNSPRAPSVLRHRPTKASGGQSSFSFSLDKGLDELDSHNKCDKPTHSLASGRQRSITHVGSEPSLAPPEDLVMTHSSEEEGQKEFLQTWQAKGPAPVCSDDETLSNRKSRHLKLKQSSSLGNANFVKKEESVENLASVINKINSNPNSDRISTKSAPQLTESVIGSNNSSSEMLNNANGIAFNNADSDNITVINDGPSSNSGSNSGNQVVNGGNSDMSNNKGENSVLVLSSVVDTASKEADMTSQMCKLSLSRQDSAVDK